jgi:hypothetical protein
LATPHPLRTTNTRVACEKDKTSMLDDDGSPA